MDVRPFQFMKASPIKKPDQLPWPLGGSPKYDGVRAGVRGGILLSKQMKPIANKRLQAILGHDRFNGLDMELVWGDPSAADCFKRSQQMCSTAEADVHDAIAFIFDDFTNLNETYEQRIGEAKTKIGGRRQTVVQGVGLSIVGQKMLKSMDELTALEAEVVGQMKFEGVMLRKMDGRYKLGRSTESEALLLKWKQFELDEAEVQDAYEQEANTNEATRRVDGVLERSHAKAGKVGKDTLGGFSVKMVSGDFKGVSCDVGSGFTDDERIALWKFWNEIKGKKNRVALFKERFGFLRVKWQKVGSKDRPRFPVAAGWRAPWDMS